MTRPPLHARAALARSLLAVASAKKTGGAPQPREEARQRPSRRHRRTPTAFIVALTIGAAAALLAFVPAIPQPQWYHDFTDRRSLFGIPRFFDVISNVPFLLVGSVGLRQLFAGRIRFIAPVERWPYATFFLGILLTGLTSAWYHLAPDNPRLAGDRLTMTIAFMGWLTAQMSERLDVRAVRTLLVTLLIVGTGSVLYWAASEALGRGDLRPYAFVHFHAAFLTVLLLWCYPPRYRRGGDVLAVIGLYALALLAEWFDRPLFEATGLLSGHTLKHLIAALAVWWALRMLRLRAPA